MATFGTGLYLVGIICFQLFLIGDTIKPNAACNVCDTTKGLKCERFVEGVKCVCQKPDTMAFDSKSGECRRRVGALCHGPGLTADLPANFKCSEDAVCAKLDHPDIARRAPVYKYVCKPGVLTCTDSNV